MAHHRRKGPKSTRAGCHICGWYKDQQFKDTNRAQTQQELRAREAEGGTRKTPSKVSLRQWIED